MEGRRIVYFSILDGGKSHRLLRSDLFGFLAGFLVAIAFGLTFYEDVAAPIIKKMLNDIQKNL